MTTKDVHDLVVFLNSAGVRMTTTWWWQDAWDESWWEDDGIGVRCNIEGCDGSYRNCLEWADARGIERSALYEFLDRYVAGRDCAVLAAYTDGKLANGLPGGN